MINAQLLSNTEKWVDVIGFEGLYQISNAGVVKSLKRQNNKVIGSRRHFDFILKPEITTLGYCRVTLSRKRFALHRIVAKHFIDNNQNKPHVNHKDGNKLNNCVENLEWCTVTENNNHALNTGLRKMPLGEKNHASKLVLDLNTGVYYMSITEAAIAKGLTYPTLKYRLTTPNCSMILV